MPNKLEIEKIKFLLPDYITGTLTEEEAQMVKNAIDVSEEVKGLYLDMKSALDFAGSVKYEEPAPQYWNNLLPRIHEKIDEREQKSLAKNPLSYIWKVLVPVAAVILIFIIYRISFTPNTEISEKEQKNLNNEKVEKNIEKPVTPITKEENIANKNNEKPRNVRHHRTEKIQKRENLANKTNDFEKPLSNEDMRKEKITHKELASIADIEELSIFGAGTPGTLDEDTENELDKLNEDQQDNLLQELSKANL
jgi:hypothetical protein